MNHCSGTAIRILFLGVFEDSILCLIPVLREDMDLFNTQPSDFNILS